MFSKNLENAKIYLDLRQSAQPLLYSATPPIPYFLSWRPWRGQLLQVEPAPCGESSAHEAFSHAQATGEPEGGFPNASAVRGAAQRAA